MLPQWVILNLFSTRLFSYRKCFSAAVVFPAPRVLLALFTHMPPGSIICLVLNKITRLTNCFLLSSSGCANGQVVERNGVFTVRNCRTGSGYIWFLAHTFCKTPWVLFFNSWHEVAHLRGADRRPTILFGLIISIVWLLMLLVLLQACSELKN